MSHHYSGPNIGFPRGDARLDLTDLYAFPSPEDPRKSILIMNVHPSVSIKPPGPTAEEAFAPEALYELKIDKDGDCIAEIAFQVRFVSSRRPANRDAALHRGSWGRRNERRRRDNHRGSAGLDGARGTGGPNSRLPFLRRLAERSILLRCNGTLNNFQFTGEDFFIDKDICSIALEVPNSILGSKPVGLWARTLIPASGAAGGWVQADRGARPNQTPFLVGEQNDAYLAGEPADDSRFIPVFAHALEHTGGYNRREAMRVAGTLLPDLLCYDPTHTAGFPGNGRALNDDVSDAFLAILTNGKVTEDGVGPHGDLLPKFPYLGPPHKMEREVGGSKR